MTFKTILTVTGVDGGDGDIKLAARLCEETGAHLAILAVAFAAPPPVGDYAVMTSDVWIQERQADMMRLVDRNEASRRCLPASAYRAMSPPSFPKGAGRTT